jgi:hypothetical protein
MEVKALSGSELYVEFFREAMDQTSDVEMFHYAYHPAASGALNKHHSECRTGRRGIRDLEMGAPAFDARRNGHQSSSLKLSAIIALCRASTFLLSASPALESP